MLAIFEGRNQYTEYDWPEQSPEPKVEIVQLGPDLRNSLLWRMRLPQPRSPEGVLDMLLGDRPTGGVGVIYAAGSPTPVAEVVDLQFDLDDLFYLLFLTLHAGARISDVGIAMLILSGRGQSEMHLGKYDRWFLDGLEGIPFQTG